MRTIILIIFAICIAGTIKAQETTQNIYITYDQPFAPKKGTHVGLTGSWDKTGILIGNFDIYPNNKVFLGVSFGSQDLINTEELLWTEQIVAARLGLRILPWTYIVGTAGNHRFEPPVYETYEGSILAEALTSYKDEFFWGGGLQINIPYIIFNKFRISAGIGYTNRNTYDFDADNFDFNTFEAAGETFKTLINSDLTFTVGVRIPLK